MILAVVLLLAASFYLYSTRPAPVTFYTDADLRAFPPVPVTEPYVKPADLVQWVSEVLPQAFTFDFVNYDNELKQLQPFFTERGWAALQTLLATYAKETDIQTNKMFVNASASGTPTIPNQGLIDGKYGWWMQMPLTIHRVTVERHNESAIIVQALVIRVPTLNNLSGIQIDNMLVQAPAIHTRTGNGIQPGTH
jgi:intracellular multiplication protein IcmL